jgi:pyruvate kinase
MNTLWGVHPVHKDHRGSAESMLKIAEKELFSKGLIRAGDVLGMVAGTKFASGATNFMRLHTVGEDDRPVAKLRRKS